MVYYIGYWLPAALFAKIFVKVSDLFSFFMGNVFLFFYSIFGVFLFFAHLLKAVKVKNFSSAAAAFFIFIFFSGMDVVGASHPVLYDSSLAFRSLHLEWWSHLWQFSSMTTVLFWVFNQGLPAWLMTMIFYNNRKDIKNFALIGLLCFFFAPLPFAGLAVFLIFYTIKFAVKKISGNKIKFLLKQIFSVQNIISVFFITPVIFLYFTSNQSAESSGTYLFFPAHEISIPFIIKGFIYFFFLEAAAYFILIFKQYKTNLIYYLSFVSLIIIPFITVGGSLDFGMRASIPALVLLSVMVIKFLLRKYNMNRRRISYIFLCLCLFFGFVTPATEFARGIKDVVIHKEILRAADGIKTFEGKMMYDYNGRLAYGNFVTVNPKKKTFFKIFAKGKKV